MLQGADRRPPVISRFNSCVRDGLCGSLSPSFFPSLGLRGYILRQLVFHLFSNVVRHSSFLQCSGNVEERAESFFNANSESATLRPRVAAASIICSLASASASIIFASSLIDPIFSASRAICERKSSARSLFKLFSFDFRLWVNSNSFLRRSDDPGRRQPRRKRFAIGVRQQQVRACYSRSALFVGF